MTEARAELHGPPGPLRGRDLRLTVGSLRGRDLDRLLEAALAGRLDEVEAELRRKWRRVRAA